jgi:hypothetical protein
MIEVQPNLRTVQSFHLELPNLPRGTFEALGMRFSFTVPNNLDGGRILVNDQVFITVMLPDNLASLAGQHVHCTLMALSSAANIANAKYLCRVTPFEG